MKQRILPVLGALAVLCAACATPTPRWTPESVAPPASTPEGVEKPASLEQRAQVVEAPAAAVPEKGLPLTRDGAILTALKNNRAIGVAQLGPQIGETYIPEARAAFDPTLMATVSTGHNTQPATSSSLANLGSASTTLPLSDLAAPGVSQALNAVQQTMAAANQRVNPSVSTTNTTGSLSVQEFLPTGTQLYLTGTASSVDSTAASDVYQGTFTVGLNQALLRGAGTAVNLITLREAQNSSAQAVHVFRGAVLDTVEQVELAYWDLVLAGEILKIREFALSLAEEQLRRNEDLLSVGKAIEGDVLTARAEKASRQADLTDAHAAIRSQTLGLVRLLNPTEAKPWSLVFDPVDPPDVVQVAIDPDRSSEIAMQYRPELAQSRLALANLDLETYRAKNAMLPQLDLVTSYGTTSRGNDHGGITRYLASDDYDNYSIGLEFQTPILYRAEKARRTRALLNQEQGTRSLANLEQTISTQVRQAAVEVQKQWDRLGATEEAVKSRTEEVRIAQERNAVGKTTTLDVLITQRDLIQSQIDGITARVNFIEALTSLYAAEGSLLERRGIRLDAAGETDTATNTEKTP